MKRWIAALSFAPAVAASALVWTDAGCTESTLWQNQTAERQGNVTVVFINDTRYRASFSCGSYDALDHSPGPATLEQRRLEAHTSSADITITCRRNFAVGTADFINRVLEIKANETATFDRDAFDVNVHFSSAPADSPGAALPDAGYAQGVNKLLGVDYSCADELIFRFVRDPDAPGGFRIDFAVIADK